MHFLLLALCFVFSFLAHAEIENFNCRTESGPKYSEISNDYVTGNYSLSIIKASTEEIDAGLDPDEMATKVEKKLDLGRKLSLKKIANLTYELHSELAGKVGVITVASANPAGTYLAELKTDSLSLQCYTNLELPDAVHAPRNDKEFCAFRKDPKYFQALLRNDANRLSFSNGPYGIASGGVCWWHNRMERNAAFLAEFLPDAPKPNADEVDGIIEILQHSRGVVEIPGYKNFRDFSADYRQKIIKALEYWQGADGLNGGAWVNGLSGISKVSPEVLKQTMDQAYKKVEGQKRPIFQMLGVPGLEAHAWVVVGMKKTNNGYSLDVLDSNFHGVKTYNYTNGMTNLDYYGKPFVPYTQQEYEDELDNLYELGNSFCENRPAKLKPRPFQNPNITEQ